MLKLKPQGIGWRGRREGRSGRGTHVNPWLIHVNVWQKPLQYCKVISLQLIKINGKKKKNWSPNALAIWYEELTHLKRPWCLVRLNAGGIGDVRGWDGCMTSLTRWTWVWFSSGSWWWTGKPGVLQSMGLQIHTWLSDWTELNVLSYDHCS